MIKITITTPTSETIIEENDSKKADKIFDDVPKKYKSYHVKYEKIKEGKPNERNHINK